MFINHMLQQQDPLQPIGGYADKPRKQKIKHLKYIDLFAGIGGFRLGFQNKSTRCVFSSEWDQYATKTYFQNFGERPHGDINKVPVKDIPDFHILLAGFPCQPFSAIGMRQGFGHNTQGTLFYNIAEILKKKKPICFVLENVKGLLTHKSGKKKTIDIILEILQTLGYEVNLKVIDAADFGVAQHRRRVFLVGFLKKYFSTPTGFQFPEPKNKKVYVNSILEKNANGHEISKRLQKNYIFKHDDGKPEIVGWKSKIRTGTLVSTYHKIQRITGTFVKDGKTGLRLLTKNECKKLMGFPKKFVIPVSRTQMYRQLGNAVVVPVIKGIACEVFKVLRRVYPNTL